MHEKWFWFLFSEISESLNIGMRPYFRDIEFCYKAFRNILCWMPHILCFINQFCYVLHRTAIHTYMLHAQMNEWEREKKNSFQIPVFFSNSLIELKIRRKKFMCWAWNGGTAERRNGRMTEHRNDWGGENPCNIRYLNAQCSLILNDAFGHACIYLDGLQFAPSTGFI